MARRPGRGGRAQRAAEGVPGPGEPLGPLHVHDVHEAQIRTAGGRRRGPDGGDAEPAAGGGESEAKAQAALEAVQRERDTLIFERDRAEAARAAAMAAEARARELAVQQMVDQEAQRQQQAQRQRDAVVQRALAPEEALSEATETAATTPASVGGLLARTVGEDLSDPGARFSVVAQRPGQPHLWASINEGGELCLWRLPPSSGRQRKEDSELLHRIPIRSPQADRRALLARSLEWSDDGSQLALTATEERNTASDTRGECSSEGSGEGGWLLLFAVAERWFEGGATTRTHGYDAATLLEANRLWAERCEETDHVCFLPSGQLVTGGVHGETSVHVPVVEGVTIGVKPDPTQPELQPRRQLQQVREEPEPEPEPEPLPQPQPAELAYCPFRG